MKKVNVEAISGGASRSILNPSAVLVGASVLEAGGVLLFTHCVVEAMGLGGNNSLVYKGIPIGIYLLYKANVMREYAYNQMAKEEIQEAAAPAHFSHESGV